MGISVLEGISTSQLGAILTANSEFIISNCIIVQGNIYQKSVSFKMDAFWMLEKHQEETETKDYTLTICQTLSAKIKLSMIVINV